MDAPDAVLEKGRSGRVRPGGWGGRPAGEGIGESERL